MALKSHLFRGDRALEDCAARDPAHITPGAQGPHVAKIQGALVDLDDAEIDEGELAAKSYGASTAAAVLSFKTKREIINRSYQSKADNIVGRMTIAAMDSLLVAKQPPVHPRFRAHCRRS
jgi:hypothetical protein